MIAKVNRQLTLTFGGYVSVLFVALMMYSCLGLLGIVEDHVAGEYGMTAMFCPLGSGVAGMLFWKAIQRIKLRYVLQLFLLTATVLAMGIWFTTWGEFYGPGDIEITPEFDLREAAIYNGLAFAAGLLISAIVSTVRTAARAVRRLTN